MTVGRHHPQRLLIKGTYACLCNYVRHGSSHNNVRLMGAHDGTKTKPYHSLSEKLRASSLYLYGAGPQFLLQ
jgi:hypothetical protein